MSSYTPFGPPIAPQSSHTAASYLPGRPHNAPILLKDESVAQHGVEHPSPSPLQTRSHDAPPRQDRVPRGSTTANDALQDISFTSEPIHDPNDNNIIDDRNQRGSNPQAPFPLGDPSEHTPSIPYGYAPAYGTPFHDPRLLPEHPPPQPLRDPRTRRVVAPERSRTLVAPLPPSPRRQPSRRATYGINTSFSPHDEENASFEVNALPEHQQPTQYGYQGYGYGHYLPYPPPGWVPHGPPPPGPGYYPGPGHAPPGYPAPAAPYSPYFYPGYPQGYPSPAPHPLPHYGYSPSFRPGSSPPTDLPYHSPDLHGPRTRTPSVTSASPSLSFGFLPPSSTSSDFVLDSTTGTSVSSPVSPASRNPLVSPNRRAPSLHLSARGNAGSRTNTPKFAAVPSGAPAWGLDRERIVSDVAAQMGGVLEKSAGDNVPPPKTEQASVPPLPPPVSPKSERSSNGPPATPRFAIRTGAPTLAVTNALVTGVLTTSPYASPASLLFQDPNISPLKDTLPPPLTAVTEGVSQPHVETKRDEQEDPANVDRLGVMGQPISNSPEGITVTVSLSKDRLVDANDVGGVLKTAGDEHQEDEVIRALSEDVTVGHRYDVQPNVDKVIKATGPGVVPKETTPATTQTSLVAEVEADYAIEVQSPSVLAPATSKPVVGVGEVGGIDAPKTDLPVASSNTASRGVSETVKTVSASGPSNIHDISDGASLPTANDESNESTLAWAVQVAASGETPSPAVIITDQKPSIDLAEAPGQEAPAIPAETSAALGTIPEESEFSTNQSSSQTPLQSAEQSTDVLPQLSAESHGTTSIDALPSASPGEESLDASVLTVSVPSKSPPGAKSTSTDAVLLEDVTVRPTSNLAAVLAREEGRTIAVPGTPKSSDDVKEPLEEQVSHPEVPMVVEALGGSKIPETASLADKGDVPVSGEPALAIGLDRVEEDAAVHVFNDATADLTITRDEPQPLNASSSRIIPSLEDTVSPGVPGAIETGSTQPEKATNVIESEMLLDQLGPGEAQPHLEDDEQANEWHPTGVASIVSPEQSTPNLDLTLGDSGPECVISMPPVEEDTPEHIISIPPETTVITSEFQAVTGDSVDLVDTEHTPATAKIPNAIAALSEPSATVLTDELVPSANEDRVREVPQAENVDVLADQSTVGLTTEDGQSPAIIGERAPAQEPSIHLLERSVEESSVNEESVSPVGDLPTPDGAHAVLPSEALDRDGNLRREVLGSSNQVILHSNLPKEIAPPPEEIITSADGLDDNQDTTPSGAVTGSGHGPDAQDSTAPAPTTPSGPVGDDTDLQETIFSIGGSSNIDSDKQVEPPRVITDHINKAEPTVSSDNLEPAVRTSVVQAADQSLSQLEDKPTIQVVQDPASAKSHVAAQDSSVNLAKPSAEGPSVDESLVSSSALPVHGGSVSADVAFPREILVSDEDASLTSNVPPSDPAGEIGVESSDRPELPIVEKDPAPVLDGVELEQDAGAGDDTTPSADKSPVGSGVQISTVEPPPVGRGALDSSTLSQETLLSADGTVVETSVPVDLLRVVSSEEENVVGKAIADSTETASAKGDHDPANALDSTIPPQVTPADSDIAAVASSFTAELPQAGTPDISKNIGQAAANQVDATSDVRSSGVQSSTSVADEAGRAESTVQSNDGAAHVLDVELGSDAGASSLQQSQAQTRTGSDQLNSEARAGARVSRPQDAVQAIESEVPRGDGSPNFGAEPLSPKFGIGRTGGDNSVFGLVSKEATDLAIAEETRNAAGVRSTSDGDIPRSAQLPTRSLSGGKKVVFASPIAQAQNLMEESKGSEARKDSTAPPDLGNEDSHVESPIESMAEGELRGAEPFLTSTPLSQHPSPTTFANSSTTAMADTHSPLHSISQEALGAGVEIASPKVSLTPTESEINGSAFEASKLKGRLEEEGDERLGYPSPPPSDIELSTSAEPTSAENDEHVDHSLPRELPIDPDRLVGPQLRSILRNSSSHSPNNNLPSSSRSTSSSLHATSAITPSTVHVSTSSPLRHEYPISSSHLHSSPVSATSPFSSRISSTTAYVQSWSPPANPNSFLLNIALSQSYVPSSSGSPTPSRQRQIELASTVQTIPQETGFFSIIGGFLLDMFFELSYLIWWFLKTAIPGILLLLLHVVLVIISGVLTLLKPLTGYAGPMIKTKRRRTTYPVSKPHMD